MKKEEEDGEGGGGGDEEESQTMQNIEKFMNIIHKANRSEEQVMITRTYTRTQNIPCARIP